MTKVKLYGDCHVEGEVRKQGEVVEMPDEIAADFGELVDKPKETAEPKEPKK